MGLQLHHNLFMNCLCLYILPSHFSHNLWTTCLTVLFTYKYLSAFDHSWAGSVMKSLDFCLLGTFSGTLECSLLILDLLTICTIMQFIIIVQKIEGTNPQQPNYLPPSINLIATHSLLGNTFIYNNI